MSAVNEALGQWYEKEQRNKKELADERMFDLIVVNRETRIVESILVWRRVSLDRAKRLKIREDKGFSSTDEVCIVLSGKAIIGRFINELDLIKI